MKKLWINIVIFLKSLGWGMRRADEVMLSQGEKNEGSVPRIEQKKETQNVYKDLLRGEVTQEVKELRHEMYYAERKSHEYGYGGNGRAIKKNNVFDYNGNIETSDGCKVLLVQDNREDPSSLYENEIYVNGENVSLGKKAIQDLSTKDKRDFTIVIKRDFIPSFRIEEYATKIVVKENGESKVLLDIYVPVYEKQFDKRSHIFLNRIESIYMGDTRSDIIDFKNLSFITFNAYGVDDLLQYEYGNIKFDNILKFDGSYVLRFIADVVINGFDIISEFYDETTAKKNAEHAIRNKKGATVNLETAIYKIEEDNYNTKEAAKLAEELNGIG